MIDKQQVWQALFAELTRLIYVAQAAATRAHETATNDANVAENKYDTLGLEAAYLAQGQQERVSQCQEDLAIIKQLAQRDVQTEQVRQGSLVTLQPAQGATQLFLLSSTAGGIKLLVDDIEVLVITNVAPLGKALHGAYVDELISLNIGDNSIEYEIIAIQ